MKIKKILKILIRYIIPLILVSWMIAINPWQDFLSRLTDVDIVPLLLALCINFGLIFTLKAWRWRMAIKNPPPFWHIYASQLEGQLANILIGMGVADFVRSSRLRKDQKDTFPEDLGTAIADRICEYMALSLMLAASTLTPWVPLIWLAAPFIFISGILLIIYRPQKLIKKFKHWPKICRAIATVNSALTVKRRMFMMIGISFLSPLTWWLDIALPCWHSRKYHGQ